MHFCAYQEIVGRIAALGRPGLIAIDGLPCAGKSALAARLEQQVGIESLYLDDFVLPESVWPRGTTPAFPFEYLRYAEFVSVVETLASSGEASYRPFDWSSYDMAREPRRIRLDRPVIIEGVSSLNPVLNPLYGLRIFVESDRATALQAAIDRDDGCWAEQWRELFLPSADLYMRTDPKSRADLVFAGRGATSDGDVVSTGSPLARE